MDYTVDTIMLRKAMLDAGIMTGADLAEKAGVSRVTVSNILTGKFRPSSAVIEKIAYALELDGSEVGRIFFKHELA